MTSHSQNAQNAKDVIQTVADSVLRAMWSTPLTCGRAKVRVGGGQANLKGAVLKNAIITGATFEGANLEGAIFEEALIGSEDAKRLCATCLLRPLHPRSGTGHLCVCL